MCVEWVEGPTKMRQGGLSKVDCRLATPEIVCDRWWVMPCNISGANNIQKTKKTWRVQVLFTSDYSTKPQPDVWYSCQPARVHKINSFMTEIVTLGGLDCTNKTFTNHSICKTMVCILQKAGLSNDKIAAVTGHCSEQSLSTREWVVFWASRLYLEIEQMVNQVLNT